MEQSKEGVLADHQIEALIESGQISASAPISPAQVQPASLDLRLGDRATRLRASFLPGKDRRVSERLADFAMHEIPLDGGALLEKGCVYVVPLREHLALPGDVSGAASAKSSTGRLDLLVRIITDDGVEFDRVPAGYEGPLYAEICPRSFSVLIHPGLSVTQLLLRRGATRLTDPELAALHTDSPIVDGTPVISDGLAFSVDLSPRKTDLVGYRAKPHTDVIDLSRLGAYDPGEFWEELRTTQGRLILDPGAFYILVSREAISIPPQVAAEMAPYLAMVGEFRVHYAGFFDPGFGHAAAGGQGARGVLEVRCHEAPFALEHGQIVGRLVYERMAGLPRNLYGTTLGSNYQGQGLKLSKHFRQKS